MFFNNIFKSLIPYLLMVLIIPSFFIPTLTNNSYITIDSPTITGSFALSSSIFSWPVPGYTKISSYFGKRTSPTAGASSFHQGIDIPAPSCTNLVAVFDGIVTFIGFNGSGRICHTLKK